MRLPKLILLAMILFGTRYLLASASDKSFVMTAAEPLIAGNTVLPPGTYVWKLLESQANHNVVQVVDRNSGRVETTVIALPTYRQEISGTNDVQFWETPKGVPRAIRTWFYPGDNYGQEFVYPKELVASLASVVPSRTLLTAPPAFQQQETERQVASIRIPRSVQQQLPPQKSSQQAGSWAVITDGNSPLQAQLPTQPTGIWDAIKHLPLTATIAPLIGLVGLGCVILAVMSNAKRDGGRQALK